MSIYSKTDKVRKSFFNISYRERCVLSPRQSKNQFLFSLCRAKSVLCFCFDRSSGYFPDFFKLRLNLTLVYSGPLEEEVFSETS